MDVWSGDRPRPGQQLHTLSGPVVVSGWARVAGVLLTGVVLVVGCEDERESTVPGGAVPGGAEHAAPQLSSDRTVDAPLASTRSVATDGAWVCWIDREVARCVGEEAFEPPVVAHPVGVAVAIGQVCVWSAAGVARCRVRAREPHDRLIDRDIDGPVREVRLSLGTGCVHRRDGSLSCWRYTSRDGAWAPAEEERVTDAYDFHQRLCGIRGGSVWCRGWNGFGQIAHGCDADDCPETAITEVSGGTEIATGVFCTCAVAGGVVECWGCLPDHPHGFWIARDTRTPRWGTAQAIDGFPRPAHGLRAGGHTFCVLDRERALHCVQLTTPGTDLPPPSWAAPTRVAAEVDDFAVGDDVVCVARAREISCFGPGYDSESIVRDLPPPGRVIARLR